MAPSVVALQEMQQKHSSPPSSSMLAVAAGQQQQRLQTSYHGEREWHRAASSARTHSSAYFVAAPHRQQRSSSNDPSRVNARTHSSAYFAAAPYRQQRNSSNDPARVNERQSRATLVPRSLSAAAAASPRSSAAANVRQQCCGSRLGPTDAPYHSRAASYRRRAASTYREKQRSSYYAVSLPHHGASAAMSNPYDHKPANAGIFPSRNICGEQEPHLHRSYNPGSSLSPRNSDVKPTAAPDRAWRSISSRRIERDYYTSNAEGSETDVSPSASSSNSPPPRSKRHQYCTRHPQERKGGKRPETVASDTRPVSSSYGRSNRGHKQASSSRDSSGHGSGRYSRQRSRSKRSNHGSRGDSSSRRGSTSRRDGTDRGYNGRGRRAAGQEHGESSFPESARRARDTAEKRAAAARAAAECAAAAGAAVLFVGGGRSGGTHRDTVLPTVALKSSPVSSAPPSPDGNAGAFSRTGSALTPTHSHNTTSRVSSRQNSFSEKEKSRAFGMQPHSSYSKAKYSGTPSRETALAAGHRLASSAAEQDLSHSLPSSERKVTPAAEDAGHPSSLFEAAAAILRQQQSRQSQRSQQEPPQQQQKARTSRRLSRLSSPSGGTELRCSVSARSPTSKPSPRADRGAETAEKRRSRRSSGSSPEGRGGAVSRKSHSPFSFLSRRGKEKPPLCVLRSTRSSSCNHNRQRLHTSRSFSPARQLHSGCHHFAYEGAREHLAFPDAAAVDSRLSASCPAAATVRKLPHPCYSEENERIHSHSSGKSLGGKLPCCREQCWCLRRSSCKGAFLREQLPCSSSSERASGFDVCEKTVLPRFTPMANSGSNTRWHKQNTNSAFTPVTLNSDKRPFSSTAMQPTPLCDNWTQQPATRRLQSNYGSQSRDALFSTSVLAGRKDASSRIKACCAPPVASPGAADERQSTRPAAGASIASSVTPTLDSCRSRPCGCVNSDGRLPRPSCGLFSTWNSGARKGTAGDKSAAPWPPREHARNVQRKRREDLLLGSCCPSSIPTTEETLRRAQFSVLQQSTFSSNRQKHLGRYIGGTSSVRRCNSDTLHFLRDGNSRRRPSVAVSATECPSESLLRGRLQASNSCAAGSDFTYHDLDAAAAAAGRARNNSDKAPFLRAVATAEHSAAAACCAAVETKRSCKRGHAAAAAAAACRRRRFLQQQAPCGSDFFGDFYESGRSSHTGVHVSVSSLRFDPNGISDYSVDALSTFGPRCTSATADARCCHEAPQKKSQDASVKHLDTFCADQTAPAGRVAAILRHLRPRRSRSNHREYHERTMLRNNHEQHIQQQFCHCSLDKPQQTCTGEADQPAWHECSGTASLIPSSSERIGRAATASEATDQRHSAPFKSPAIQEDVNSLLASLSHGDLGAAGSDINIVKRSTSEPCSYKCKRRHSFSCLTHSGACCFFNSAQSLLAAGDGSHGQKLCGRVGDTSLHADTVSGGASTAFQRLASAADTSSSPCCQYTAPSIVAASRQLNSSFSSPWCTALRARSAVLSGSHSAASNIEFDKHKRLQHTLDQDNIEEQGFNERSSSTCASSSDREASLLNRSANAAPSARLLQSLTELSPLSLTCKNIGAAQHTAAERLQVAAEERLLESSTPLAFGQQHGYTLEDPDTASDITASEYSHMYRSGRGASSLRQGAFADSYCNSRAALGRSRCHQHELEETAPTTGVYSVRERLKAAQLPVLRRCVSAMPLQQLQHHQVGSRTALAHHVEQCIYADAHMTSSKIMKRYACPQSNAEHPVEVDATGAAPSSALLADTRPWRHAVTVTSEANIAKNSHAAEGCEAFNAVPAPAEIFPASLDCPGVASPTRFVGRTAAATPIGENMSSEAIISEANVCGTQLAFREAENRHASTPPSAFASPFSEAAADAAASSGVSSADEESNIAPSASLGAPADRIAANKAATVLYEATEKRSSCVASVYTRPRRGTFARAQHRVAVSRRRAAEIQSAGSSGVAAAAPVVFTAGIRGSVIPEVPASAHGTAVTATSSCPTAALTDAQRNRCRSVRRLHRLLCVSLKAGRLKSASRIASSAGTRQSRSAARDGHAAEQGKRAAVAVALDAASIASALVRSHSKIQQTRKCYVQQQMKEHQKYLPIEQRQQTVCPTQHQTEYRVRHWQQKVGAGRGESQSVKAKESFADSACNSTADTSLQVGKADSFADSRMPCEPLVAHAAVETGAVVRPQQPPLLQKTRRLQGQKGAQQHGHNPAQQQGVPPWQLQHDREKQHRCMQEQFLPLVHIKGSPLHPQELAMAARKHSRAQRLAQLRRQKRALSDAELPQQQQTHHDTQRVAGLQLNRQQEGQKRSCNELHGDSGYRDTALDQQRETGDKKEACCLAQRKKEQNKHFPLGCLQTSDKRVSGDCLRGHPPHGHCRGGASPVQALKKHHPPSSAQELLSELPPLSAAHASATMSSTDLKNVSSHLSAARATATSVRSLSSPPSCRRLSHFSSSSSSSLSSSSACRTLSSVASPSIPDTSVSVSSFFNSGSGAATALCSGPRKAVSVAEEKQLVRPFPSAAATAITTAADVVAAAVAEAATAAAKKVVAATAAVTKPSVPADNIGYIREKKAASPADADRDTREERTSRRGDESSVQKDSVEHILFQAGVPPLTFTITPAATYHAFYGRQHNTSAALGSGGAAAADVSTAVATSTSVAPIMQADRILRPAAAAESSSDAEGNLFSALTTTGEAVKKSHPSPAKETSCAFSVTKNPHFQISSDIAAAGRCGAGVTSSDVLQQLQASRSLSPASSAVGTLYAKATSEIATALPAASLHTVERDSAAHSVAADEDARLLFAAVLPPSTAYVASATAAGVLEAPTPVVAITRDCSDAGHGSTSKTSGVVAFPGDPAPLGNASASPAPGYVAATLPATSLPAAAHPATGIAVTAPAVNDAVKDSGSATSIEKTGLATEDDHPNDKQCSSISVAENPQSQKQHRQQQHQRQSCGPVGAFATTEGNERTAVLACMATPFDGAAAAAAAAEEEEAYATKALPVHRGATGMATEGSPAAGTAVATAAQKRVDNVLVHGSGSSPIEKPSSRASADMKHADAQQRKQQSPPCTPPLVPTRASGVDSSQRQQRLLNSEVFSPPSSCCSRESTDRHSRKSNKLGSRRCYKSHVSTSGNDCYSTRPHERRRHPSPRPAGTNADINECAKRSEGSSPFHISLATLQRSESLSHIRGNNSAVRRQCDDSSTGQHTSSPESRQSCCCASTCSREARVSCSNSSLSHSVLHSSGSKTVYLPAYKSTRSQKGRRQRSSDNSRVDGYEERSAAVGHIVNSSSTSKPEANTAQFVSTITGSTVRMSACKTLLGTEAAQDREEAVENEELLVSTRRGKKWSKRATAKARQKREKVLPQSSSLRSAVAAAAAASATVGEVLQAIEEMRSNPFQLRTYRSSVLATSRSSSSGNGNRDRDKRTDNTSRKRSSPEPCCYTHLDLDLDGHPGSGLTPRHRRRRLKQKPHQLQRFIHGKIDNEDAQEEDCHNEDSTILDAEDMKLLQQTNGETFARLERLFALATAAEEEATGRDNSTDAGKLQSRDPSTALTAAAVHAAYCGSSTNGSSCYFRHEHLLPGAAAGTASTTHFTLSARPCGCLALSAATASSPSGAALSLSSAVAFLENDMNSSRIPIPLAHTAPQAVFATHSHSSGITEAVVQQLDVAHWPQDVMFQSRSDALQISRAEMHHQHETQQEQQQYTESRQQEAQQQSERNQQQQARQQKHQQQDRQQQLHQDEQQKQTRQQQQQQRCEQRERGQTQQEGTQQQSERKQHPKREQEHQQQHETQEEQQPEKTQKHQQKEEGTQEEEEHQQQGRQQQEESKLQHETEQHLERPQKQQQQDTHQQLHKGQRKHLQEYENQSREPHRGRPKQDHVHHAGNDRESGEPQQSDDFHRTDEKEQDRVPPQTLSQKQTQTEKKKSVGPPSRRSTLTDAEDLEQRQQHLLKHNMLPHSRVQEEVQQQAIDIGQQQQKLHLVELLAENAENLTSSLVGAADEQQREGQQRIFQQAELQKQEDPERLKMQQKHISLCSKEAGPLQHSSPRLPSDLPEQGLQTQRTLIQEGQLHADQTQQPERDTGPGGLVDRSEQSEEQKLRIDKPLKIVLRRPVSPHLEKGASSEIETPPEGKETASGSSRHRWWHFAQKRRACSAVDSSIRHSRERSPAALVPAGQQRSEDNAARCSSQHELLQQQFHVTEQPLRQDELEPQQQVSIPPLQEQADALFEQRAGSSHQQQQHRLLEHSCPQGHHKVHLLQDRHVDPLQFSQSHHESFANSLVNRHVSFEHRSLAEEALGTKVRASARAERATGEGSPAILSTGRMCRIVCSTDADIKAQQAEDDTHASTAPEDLRGVPLEVSRVPQEEQLCAGTELRSEQLLGERQQDHVHESSHFSSLPSPPSMPPYSPARSEFTFASPELQDERSAAVAELSATRTSQEVVCGGTADEIPKVAASTFHAGAAANVPGLSPVLGKDTVAVLKCQTTDVPVTAGTPTAATSSGASRLESTAAAANVADTRTAAAKVLSTQAAMAATSESQSHHEPSGGSFDSAVAASLSTPGGRQCNAAAQGTRLPSVEQASRLWSSLDNCVKRSAAVAQQEANQGAVIPPSRAKPLHTTESGRLPGVVGLVYACREDEATPATLISETAARAITAEETAAGDGCADTEAMSAAPEAIGSPSAAATRTIPTTGSFELVVLTGVESVKPAEQTSTAGTLCEGGRHMVISHSNKDKHGIPSQRRGYRSNSTEDTGSTTSRTLSSSSSRSTEGGSLGTDSTRQGLCSSVAINNGRRTNKGDRRACRNTICGRTRTAARSSSSVDKNSISFASPTRARTVAGSACPEHDTTHTGERNTSPTSLQAASTGVNAATEQPQILAGNANVSKGDQSAHTDTGKEGVVAVDVPTMRQFDYVDSHTAPRESHSFQENSGQQSSPARPAGMATVSVRQHSNQSTPQWKRCLRPPSSLLGKSVNSASGRSNSKSDTATKKRSSTSDIKSSTDKAYHNVFAAWRKCPLRSAMVRFSSGGCAWETGRTAASSSGLSNDSRRAKTAWLRLQNTRAAASSLSATRCQCPSRSCSIQTTHSTYEAIMNIRALFTDRRFKEIYTVVPGATMLAEGGRQRSAESKPLPLISASEKVCTDRRHAEPPEQVPALRRSSRASSAGCRSINKSYKSTGHRDPLQFPTKYLRSKLFRSSGSSSRNSSVSGRKTCSSDEGEHSDELCDQMSAIYDGKSGGRCDKAHRPHSQGSNSGGRSPGEAGIRDTFNSKGLHSRESISSTSSKESEHFVDLNEANQDVHSIFKQACSVGSQKSWSPAPVDNFRAPEMSFVPKPAQRKARKAPSLQQERQPSPRKEANATQLDSGTSRRIFRRPPLSAIDTLCTIFFPDECQGHRQPDGQNQEPLEKPIEKDTKDTPQQQEKMKEPVFRRLELSHSSLPPCHKPSLTEEEQQPQQLVPPCLAAQQAHPGYQSLERSEQQQQNLHLAQEPHGQSMQQQVQQHLNNEQAQQCVEATSHIRPQQPRQQHLVEQQQEPSGSSVGQALHALIGTASSRSVSRRASLSLAKTPLRSSESVSVSSTPLCPTADRLGAGLSCSGSPYSAAHATASGARVTEEASTSRAKGFVACVSSIEDYPMSALRRISASKENPRTMDALQQQRLQHCGSSRQQELGTSEEAVHRQQPERGTGEFLRNRLERCDQRRQQRDLPNQRDVAPGEAQMKHCRLPEVHELHHVHYIAGEHQQQCSPLPRHQRQVKVASPSSSNLHPRLRSDRNTLRESKELYGDEVRETVQHQQQHHQHHHHISRQLPSQTSNDFAHCTFLGRSPNFTSLSTVHLATPPLGAAPVILERDTDIGSRASKMAAGIAFETVRVSAVEGTSAFLTPVRPLNGNFTASLAYPDARDPSRAAAGGVYCDTGAPVPPFITISSGAASPAHKVTDGVSSTGNYRCTTSHEFERVDQRQHHQPRAGQPPRVRPSSCSAVPLQMQVTCVDRRQQPARAHQLTLWPQQQREVNRNQMRLQQQAQVDRVLRGQTMWPQRVILSPFCERRANSAVPVNFTTRSGRHITSSSCDSRHSDKGHAHEINPGSRLLGNRCFLPGRYDASNAANHPSAGDVDRFTSSTGSSCRTGKRLPFPLHHCSPAAAAALHRPLAAVSQRVQQRSPQQLSLLQQRQEHQQSGLLLSLQSSLQFFNAPGTKQQRQPLHGEDGTGSLLLQRPRSSRSCHFLPSRSTGATANYGQDSMAVVERRLHSRNLQQRLLQIGKRQQLQERTVHIQEQPASPPLCTSSDTAPTT